jgi:hypothetical protein
MTISRWILLIMRNVPDKFVEETKTNTSYSINFFRKSCRKMWCSQTTNDVTCWASKTTRTHAGTRILPRSRTPNTCTYARKRAHTDKLFRGRNDSRKRLNIILYVHYLSCLLLVLILLLLFLLLLFLSMVISSPVCSFQSFACLAGELQFFILSN